MAPDARIVSRLRPSPHGNERRGAGVPDMILLHYTGMTSGKAAEDWLCDPRAQVSAHYLVHEDGEVVQMVSEAARAWHAGAGSWQGREDVNSQSIGIEIVNPGHEHGYRAFPDVQVASVIELCRDCAHRWTIRPERVLAHSDTAPSRKEDPGELFPWDKLFQAGIGHWRESAAPSRGPVLERGSSGHQVDAFQRLLAAYGYAVDPTGTFDDATVFATIAFQRHFRQARVDGRADASTIETLRALYAALDRRAVTRPSHSSDCDIR
ncbi:peptidoglycan recognition protein family protein [Antarcticirhabdus aurantiaca]|uniref:peptidoglycan recognition protein family protein n=1 Tax=Antarcticirhabdus aurantiaca TaxID=2606717 RepID=UPI003BB7DE3F